MKALLKNITPTRLIILSALFFVLVDNAAFFRNVIGVYPVSLNNAGFLASLAIVLTSVMALLLSLVASKYTLKPVLIILLLVSSIAGYFMNNFNIVIDDTMIRGILATDVKEAFELISIKFFLYFLVFGVFPSAAVFYVNVQYGPLRKELGSRLKLIAICLLVIFFSLLVFSKFYTSFLSEHKPLRYRTNPTYSLYSMGKYIKGQFKDRRILKSNLSDKMQKFRRRSGPGVDHLGHRLKQPEWIDFLSMVIRKRPIRCLRKRMSSV